MYLLKWKYRAGLCLMATLLLLFRDARAKGTAPGYDTVFVTDFGIRPNSREDAVPAVQAALEACREKQNPLLFFPAGRYDFHPRQAVKKIYYESNTTDNNPKANAIMIEGFKRLAIDGAGSSFICHGRIQPFTIDHSSNVAIRRVSIDWDFPLTAQATVLDTTDAYIDVKIDSAQYPYTLQNQQLLFAAEGWSGKITGIMEYEKGTHLIAYRTGDAPGALGPGWQKYTAEALGNNTIRLLHRFQRKPSPGNILVLRHNSRDHAMIFIFHSNNIQVEELDGYHCAGLGILSQYSGDLTFKHVNIVPNEAKDRYFSGHDDGLHFSNCKGNILVDSCRFGGLMDDPINVHGTYVKIIKKLDRNKLLCRFMEHMSVGMVWSEPGDRVAFVDHHSLATIGASAVTAFRPESTTDFELTLSGDIPAQVKEGDGLENLDWTPALTVRHSSFESCRARGLLVTTPKKVVIEDNRFQSSGSAILVAGDVNSWYESGAVTDMLIKGNQFLAPCNTSDYQFTEAVISIYPEIPVMNASTPAYHKNIRIEDNSFQAFDYPILFAQSVNGLQFTRNNLVRNNDYAPYHARKATFFLSGCRNVIIKNNKVDPRLLGKNVQLQLMDKKSVQCQKELTVGAFSR
jgi:hypothetical protein